MPDYKAGTKLEFTNEHGTFTVHVNSCDMSIDDIYQSLIKPVLLAAGYHNDKIVEYFEGEE